MTLSLDLLAAPIDPAYRRMTFPHYRPLLEARSRRTVAVAAHLMDEPIGLALAQIDSAGVVARLHSLYVVEPERRHGIASSLIAKLEEALRERGCSKVDAVYATGGGSVPALERLITTFDWAPPVPRSLIIKVLQADLLSDERIQGMAQLEPPFTMCAWREVTAEQRKQVRQSQRRTGWIPAELDPFENEAGADLRTSVALRHGDEVVGWIIMHELDPQTGRVTAGWVREDLQRTAKGVPLMALVVEVARRGVALGHRYAISVVNFTQPKMARFSEHVFAPHAVSKQETRYTEKAL